MKKAVLSRKPPLSSEPRSRRWRRSGQKSSRNFNGLSPLELAKQRLNIFDLWHRLGLEGEPKRSCRCPWREDRKPSFSVSSDGKLWFDFGEGVGGDVVAFVARALDLSMAEAARKFLELAGSPTATFPAPRPAPTKPKPPTKVVLPPDARIGSRREWEALAVLRSLPLRAIAAAAVSGNLLFAEYKDRSAWIVCDSTLRNAQARRIDGLPWWENGRKSLSLPGSQASWPIGADEIAQASSVLLVEGQPDLVAAYAVALREQPTPAVCCMTGANTSINPDAVEYFEGKLIRIFAHSDEPGEKAAFRWARQLRGAGAEPQIVSFAGLVGPTGKPIGDLNDFVSSPYWRDWATLSLCPDCWDKGVASQLGSPFGCPHSRGGLV